jgi:small-conductance mechanosensitive channel
VMIFSVASVRVLSLLGFPITGLVAPATVLGVALGFGAQRIVQDLLAGVFVITERQYSFGDLVRVMPVGSSLPMVGTVEEVTLRMTRLRSSDGEVIIIPNGQILHVTNLSRDWARAVVDVPLPPSTDITEVNRLLRQVGAQAFADPALRPLLLDEPTVMGVESLTVNSVNIRMVARTLPGKQFEVGRRLRARIVTALRQNHIAVSPTAVTSSDAASGEEDTGELEIPAESSSV